MVSIWTTGHPDLNSVRTCRDVSAWSCGNVSCDAGLYTGMLPEQSVST